MYYKENKTTSHFGRRHTGAGTTADRNYLNVSDDGHVLHEANGYKILAYDQVCRLNEVLESNIPVISTLNGAPPVQIQISLKEFLLRVKANLEDEKIAIQNTRLNGGLASYVIGMKKGFSYNDYDLLFSVDLNSEPDINQRIKTAVLNALISFMDRPCSNSEYKIVNQQQIAQANFNPALCSVKESFIDKLIRINDPGSEDSWYLIGIGKRGNGAKTVELKFVEQMRRQYEFSVDSFQIGLDSLLNFYQTNNQNTFNENFYPTVVAETMWPLGFQDAATHLSKKLIATVRPEEIRGGGLLKYCKLLVENYRPHSAQEMKQLERYMCSRFFIDFPTLALQHRKLESYLYNHFDESNDIRLKYMQMLYTVINNSTVCLMSHERYETLNLIDQLINEVMDNKELSGEYEQQSESTIEIEAFSTKEWTIDGVWHGVCMAPSQTISSASSFYSSSNSNTSLSSPSIDYNPLETFIICTSPVLE